MKRINQYVCKVTLIAFFGLVLLGVSDNAYGQSPRYSFQAAAADYCGRGGIHFWGFEQDDPNWAVYPDLPSPTSPNDYVAYSWHLNDAQGVIASGSYDSRTGVTTGSSLYNFQVSRYPIGTVSDMSYTVTGSFYTSTGAYGPCQESFQATTYTTASSGGYFHYQ